MLIEWLLRWFIPHYDVMILNPQTQQPSGKSVFATLSFVVGIGGCIVSIAADVRAGRPVEKTAVLLLLANGSLLAGMKVFQQQLNRRTADEAGQPLAVPPPADHAPEVMPQVPNPNVPSDPNAQGAPQE